MLSCDRWITWNFDDLGESGIQSNLKVYLPEFMRVRTLAVTRLPDGKSFVTCDCKKRIRSGIPCSCFFRIADNGVIPFEDIIDIGMVDARFLKYYNSHYGDSSEIGDRLYEAQQECFDYEQEGTQVTPQFLDQLLGNEDDDYPKLGPGTSETDLKEAFHVLNTQTCLRFDL